MALAYLPRSKTLTPCGGGARTSEPTFHIVLSSVTSTTNCEDSIPSTVYGRNSPAYLRCHTPDTSNSQFTIALRLTEVVNKNESRYHTISYAISSIIIAQDSSWLSPEAPKTQNLYNNYLRICDNEKTELLITGYHGNTRPTRLTIIRTIVLKSKRRSSTIRSSSIASGL